jgi:hypothetical protein
MPRAMRQVLAARLVDTELMAGAVVVTAGAVVTAGVDMGGAVAGVGARGWGWWPLGIYASVLPWYYSTYWWNGIPYYYADNNYYTWNGSEYEQVQPPAGFNPPAPSPAAPGSDEVFAYPKNGQSAAKQATDKSECRAWAASQTGYSAAANSAAQHQNYLRAEAACLEGRGYAAR